MFRKQVGEMRLRDFSIKLIKKVSELRNVALLFVSDCGKIFIEIISTYRIFFYALGGVIFFVESESYTPVTFYGSDTHSFLTSYNEKTLVNNLTELFVITYEIADKEFSLIIQYISNNSLELFTIIYEVAGKEFSLIIQYIL